MKHSQEDTVPPGLGLSIRPAALMHGCDPATGMPKLLVVAWASTVLHYLGGLLKTVTACPPGASSSTTCGTAALAVGHEYPALSSQEGVSHGFGSILGGHVPPCIPNSTSMVPGNQLRDTPIQTRGGRQIANFIC